MGKAYERITESARRGKKALLLQNWPFLRDPMNENRAIERDLGGLHSQDSLSPAEPARPGGRWASLERGA